MLQIVYTNTLKGTSRVVILAPAAALCRLIAVPTMAWLFGFDVGLRGSGSQLISVRFAFPIGLMFSGFILQYSFRHAIR